MKFSEVPIGARFRVKAFNADYIKVHNKDSCKNCVELDEDSREIMFFYISKSFEVELITKCKNCKLYNKTCWAKRGVIETRGVLINYTNEFQDPETFSCSLFEMKGN